MLTQLTFSSSLPQSFSVVLKISALYLRISALRLPTMICDIISNQLWCHQQSIVTSSAINCDIISNQLWCHQQSIVTSSAINCDIISNQLWCHQQNINQANETEGWCVKIVNFIVIYHFFMSCKKWDDVSTLNMNCLYGSGDLTHMLTKVWFWCLCSNEGNKHKNIAFINSSPIESVQYSIFISPSQESYCMSILTPL